MGKTRKYSKFDDEVYYEDYASKKKFNDRRKMRKIKDSNRNHFDDEDFI